MAPWICLTCDFYGRPGSGTVTRGVEGRGSDTNIRHLGRRLRPNVYMFVSFSGKSPNLLTPRAGGLLTQTGGHVPQTGGHVPQAAGRVTDVSALLHAG